MVNKKLLEKKPLEKVSSKNVFECYWKKLIPYNDTTHLIVWFNELKILNKLFDFGEGEKVKITIERIE